MKRKLLIKAALALALLFGVSWSSARAAQLIGYNTYGGDGVGVYSIPIDGTTACTKLAASGYSSVKTAVLAGDTYYTSTSTGMAYNPTVKHQVWSVDGWTSTEYAGAAGQVPQAACYNPTDGKVYGFFQNVSTFNFELKAIEYGSTTSVSDVIAAVLESTFGTNQSVVAMAAAADGTMYAISSNGKLCSVTKDGTCTAIGNIGVSGTVAGAAIDPATGTFYYAVYSSGSKLYTINVTNATANLVAELDGGMSFMGLGFLDGGGGTQPTTPTDVPNSVTNLSVNFPEGSLTGTISFDMPTTLADGASWDGPCNYVIWENGVPGEPVPSSYGAHVETSYTVAAAGDYGFMVTANNELGNGSMDNYASVTVTDAAATPKKPGAVTNLTYHFEPGSLDGTVTFDMPSTYDDGTAATGECRYAVQIGFSDPQVTGASEFGATGVTANIHVDSFDVPYYCIVYAENEAGSGEPAYEYNLTAPSASQPVTPAPGNVSNLEAHFTAGNLNGYVTFDMPSTYADGTAATGLCDYAVEIDWGSDPVKKGTANYGDKGVRADFAFPAFDEEHAIRVYTENEAGSCDEPQVIYGYSVPAASAEPVAPGAVTNLDVVTTKGSKDVTIKFDMPTTLADGSTPAEGAPLGLMISIQQVGGMPAMLDPVTAKYGESKSLPYTVGDFGTYTCSIVVVDPTSEDGLYSESVSKEFTVEEATVTPPTPSGNYKLIGYAVGATNVPKGVYTVPTDGSTDCTLEKAFGNYVKAAVMAGDTYYTSSRTSSNAVSHQSYNAQTWELIADTQDPAGYFQAALASTYNPADGVVYGFHYDADYKCVFGSFDYASMTWTDKKVYGSNNASDDFCATAFAADGTCYAIRKNGKVYTINTANGEETEIGKVNVNVSTSYTYDYSAGAAFHPVTGLLYYSAGDKLYTIDVKAATLEATEVATLNVGQCAGLAFVEVGDQPVEPVAPADVTDLEVATEKGSNTVKVSFKMPTILADGTEPAADAQLVYMISIQNAENPMPMTDGGQATYGELIEKSYELAYGTYTCSVIACDYENDLYSEGVSKEFTVEEATVTPPTPAATELVGYFVSPTGAAPGVYSISETDGSYELVKPMKQNVASAVMANDTYYITTQSGSWGNKEICHYGYDTFTWEQTLEKNFGNQPLKVAYASAYNPADGKVYAVFPDADMNDLFCTYDYDTDTTEPILVHRASSPSDDFLAMAIAADGTIYAVRANGKLFTLDKETGGATEIGPTGLSLVSMQTVGATIDPATGTFYLADNNKLYTIDVATGAATELVALEGAGRIVGLGMRSTEAPAPKPNPVEKVSVNFEGESLTGNVTFTTPSKLTDGTDGEGELTYEVKVNGVVKATAATGFGKEVTTPDFTLEAGEYEFAVSVSNEAGTSEPVKVTKRIGAVPLTGIVPPYFNALNTEDSAEGFTMLNLNNDGLNWVFDSQNNKFYMGFNETMDMNAWMITPEINLEADKLYEVSIKAYCGSSKFNERVAMWLGTEANPEMMIIPVLEPTDVKTTAGETLTGYITVKTDGKYYLGVKGCSDKDMQRLYVSDLSISAPRAGECPGDVNFTVTSAVGSLAAEIELQAPSTDVAGKPLASIDKIELRRGNELIKTFDSPAVGATLNHHDNVTEDGAYTYSAVAYNSYGAGRVVKVTKFIGTPVPASPANARIQETSKTGEVTVTWDAPTTDQDGNEIDPSAVTYMLVEAYSHRTVADDIKGTSYTFQAVEEGAEQDMLQYGVFAKSATGIAPNAAMTEIYPAGPAYALPVEESFPDGDVANNFNWAGSSSETAWWEPATNDDGLDAQDNDNGLMSSTANKIGAQATLYFGKIAIAETAVNPVLTYWYCKFEECHNTVTTFVEADGVTSNLGTVVCGPDSYGWNRAYVPLDAYKGKNVRIKLVTTAVDFISTAIDNIRVFDQPDKDLTAVALNAPTNANAGQDMPVTVAVLNSGRQTASDYTVELFVDNEPLATKAGTALEEGETANVAFDVPVSPGSPASIKLKAVVNYEGDENTADNTTDEVTVDIKISTLPAPTDLAADNSTGSVVLRWTAPKLENATAPEPVTDIFDDIASFTVDPDCGWTFLDVDETTTWAFTDVKFPNEGYKGVGIVYDGSKYPSSIVDLTAYSGDKFFLLMDALRAQNDDWMISPELTGAAQTVSFYARPVQPAYSEEFEVYYSTTGKEIKDFKMIEKVATMEGGWKEYSYQLPEGAKYFAIHFISNDQLALAIDDITYIPANADLTSLTLKGYNVYRDGEKINDSLVTETTYTDAGNAGVDREYFVTAVYEQGESAASNKVMPSTGVGSVYGSDITVVAGRGVITVTGAEGMDVAVYTTDGRTIYNEAGAQTTHIRIEAGVYVVKAGDVTRKVVVK